MMRFSDCYASVLNICSSRDRSFVRLASGSNQPVDDFRGRDSSVSNVAREVRNRRRSSGHADYSRVEQSDTPIRLGPSNASFRCTDRLPQAFDDHGMQYSQLCRSPSLRSRARPTWSPCSCHARSVFKYLTGSDALPGRTALCEFALNGSKARASAIPVRL